MLLSEQLLIEWHPTLNEGLNPTDFSAGSGKKVWWLGKDCGHEWFIDICNRTAGSGCPYCAGKKVLAGFNDLGSTNLELAKLWNPTKNGGLRPTDVTEGSHKKVWWLDPFCGHEWLNSVYGQSKRKIACQVCTNHQRQIGVNDFQSERPLMALEWHPTRNTGIRLAEISTSTKTKVWWLCTMGHEWLTSPHSRAHRNSGCPYCSGRNAISGKNDLETLYPEITKYWHPTKNGELKANQFLPNSGKKVWWLCEAGHEDQVVIASKVKGHGCAYCSGRKRITGSNDFLTLYPELSKEFIIEKNAPLQVSDLAPQSHVKVWWKCDNHHEWKTSPSERTRKSPTNCPICAISSRTSKAEIEISSWLTSKGITHELNNRTLLKPFEVDIYLPDHNIAIEYNGLNWHTEERGKHKHYHYNKWNLSKQKNIQLIQIWEDDWRENQTVILKSLEAKLGIWENETVFARKTTIQLLTNTEAQKFLDANHIQGFASGSYYIGLQDSHDSLQAVMVLKKERNNTLNILRYATDSQVIGGFTKLLKYAERVYQPNSFITFADHTISNGGLYKNNGFIADKELRPDYMYVVKQKRKHKFGYRLKRFKTDPGLLWQEGLSESQLALLNKIPRIWDAGKTRYIKIL